MKKQILNLGKALNKAEQRSINGGQGLTCAEIVCPSCTICFQGFETENAYCIPDPTQMCMP
jgi:hypothetical protein